MVLMILDFVAVAVVVVVVMIAVTVVVIAMMMVAGNDRLQKGGTEGGNKRIFGSLVERWLMMKKK